MENKNKKIIVIICLLVILTLAVIGISYAAFTYVRVGEKVNQITTGTISMNYEESDNIISITNALPTMDETGKVRLVDGEYFDFSITTNIKGNTMINYEIAAEDFLDNTFDGSNVKFYLTKLVGNKEEEVSTNLPAVYKEEQEENVNTGRPSGMMSLLTGSIFTQGEETTNYRLRLYVDEAYNPQGDGGGLVFKTRINVYGRNATLNYQINKNEITGGNINVATSADYESMVKITPVPEKGYTYDGVVITDEEENELLTLNKDETSFKMPLGNIKITPIWKKIVYTISKIDEAGGTITIGDTSTIGEKVSFETKANAGYTYNGAVVKDSKENTLFTLTYEQTSFEMPAANVTITSKWELLPIMKAYTSSSTSDYHNSTYKSKITSIVTKPNTNIPNSALANWDVSQAGNRSVIAYVENDGSGGYKLTIGGKGGIAANPNSGWVFYRFKTLKSIDLTYFDTSKATRMDNMFYDCSSVARLEINHFDTYNVTTMEQMFRNTAIKDLDLSNWNTSKVTNMAEMFRNCSYLTTLIIKNFDTSHVTNMSNMFASCGRLTSLDVRHFDTSNVTDMHGMFQCCDDLTTLDLTSFDTAKVTTMKAMFYRNSNLKTILISSKWITAKSTSDMFYYCPAKLTVV